MKIQTSLSLCCALSLMAACIDPISSPPCVEPALTQTSVSGDTITLSSGLRYIEGATGSGSPAKWCLAIVTHHTEYLLDGTRLYSTHDDDRPLVFTPGLGDLIDGYEQGVIGMRNGGTRRLIIPPELAYGSQPQLNSSGQVVIPANSTLVYDIEVFNVAQ